MWLSSAIYTRHKIMTSSIWFVSSSLWHLPDWPSILNCNVDSYTDIGCPGSIGIHISDYVTYGHICIQRIVVYLLKVNLCLSLEFGNERRSRTYNLQIKIIIIHLRIVWKRIGYIPGITCTYFGYLWNWVNLLFAPIWFISPYLSPTIPFVSIFSLTCQHVPLYYL